MQFDTRNQFLKSELKYLLPFPRGKQKMENEKNGKTKKKMKSKNVV